MPNLELPPFLDTQRLREVYQASVVYFQATQDRTMMDALKVALKFAESVERPDSYSNCRTCGTRIPKGKHYCCFDCAEEDGAIEK